MGALLECTTGHSQLLEAIELIAGLKTKVEADGVKQAEAYKKYKETNLRPNKQKEASSRNRLSTDLQNKAFSTEANGCKCPMMSNVR